MSSSSSFSDTSSTAAPGVPADWLAEFEAEQKRIRIAERKHVVGTVEERLQKLRAKAMKRRAKASRRAARAEEDRLLVTAAVNESPESDEEYLLGEYKAEESRNSMYGSSSSEGDADQDDDWLAQAMDPNNDNGLLETQILYCSRTHSQLAQFVNEIKKTAFRNVRVVALGSRRSLCIHDRVRHLGPTAR